MKPVPYTTPTGIQIGRAYSPPARALAFDHDADRIQSALLGRRSAVFEFLLDTFNRNTMSIYVVMILFALVAGLTKPFWR